jgi:P-type Ca2+ transporter type 2C
VVAAQVAEPVVQRAPVHTEDAGTVLARLGTDPTRGLSEEEAARRLAQDGSNELPQPEGKSALSRIVEQFSNPIVLTLLAAAVIALIDGASRTGEPILVRFGDATAILIIVAINAVLGFAQESRAEAALAALETMQTPNARVRRDGTTRVVAASGLVAGDVLELEAGDAVPADARLLQTIGLFAEESALTGESVPVAKDARAACADDAPLGDRGTMLFVGTNVVRGKAVAVVVATGPRTELGHLSALIHRHRDRTTPLEEKLDGFGKRILWGCLALSGVLFARGMIRGDRSWHELLLEAVSLAVAAIPEGLPAITTITLALGMQRMAKNGAIIRKLAAVETLGAATVICTDKTGTLTQNAMTVREIFAGGTRYRATGGGYDPAGAVLDSDGQTIATPQSAPQGPTRGPLRDLLSTIALCNNAALQHRDGAWRVQGDPTEGALLTLAAKGGVSREEITSSHQVIRELPFDGDRKRMTIVALDERGNEVAHSKGSADVLLPLCTDLDTEDGPRPLDDQTRRAILDEAERMSNQALRVLAVAKRDLGQRPRAGAPLEDAAMRKSIDIEDRLTFLGLVGMVDPPRDGVREAVARCAEAHVRAVMITGDHKLTAVAIAKELGLWDERAIALTGAEVEKLSDDELATRIDDVRVFARVTAEQKLRIVARFKARGHIVAMTGDGVNDAPALREAHIGVAMGKSGTDVAREAADMVIADDNFATIVEAVREGRAIWRNIQKFIFFLLSSNAGLLFAVFAVSFFTELPPLTPLMILWINLVTNGLPALALGVDVPDPTQMREPPRRSSAGLLSLRDWLGMAAVGALMGGAALIAYVAPALATGGSEPGIRGRAMAFSVLALSPLFHAFNCRSQTASIVSLRPIFPLALVGAVAVSAAIHLTAVVVPHLRPVFRTFAMDGREWAVLLVLCASIVPAIEILKLVDRLRTRARA